MIGLMYVPDNFGRSILIPNPKIDSVSAKAHVEDYRGISIAPVVLK